MTEKMIDGGQVLHNVTERSRCGVESDASTQIASFMLDMAAHHSMVTEVHRRSVYGT